MTSRSDAAQRYATFGLAIFPLHHPVPRGCSCGRVCEHIGKHPRTANGFAAATRDAAQVRAWWTEWPDANIGCVPGRSGHLVIDVDGPAGEATAQRLGLLSEPTLQVVTGREDGGRHRWYKHPGGHIGNAPLGDHLDVRADAGYVLLPPSVHGTGRVYRWLGLFDEVILPPPAVVAQLRNPAPSGARAPIGDSIPKGQRDAVLTRIGGALRRVGLTSDMIRTALAALNARHVTPALSDGDVERIARSVSRYAPAPVVPALTRTDVPLRRTA